MKRFVVFLTLAILAIGTTLAQSENQNTTAISVEEIKEQKKVIKNVEKQEKAVAKAEKAAKKTEKKRKKEEKLAKAIKSKKKSILKNEKRVGNLQGRLERGEANGKLSPIDIKKMNAKRDKLKVSIAKDKEKLAKLLKKQ